MATAPPAFFDPAQLQFSRSYVAQPPPVTSRSNPTDVLKVLVGLLIVLLLGAILGTLLYLYPKSGIIAGDESNEKIIKLLVDSNERIARLQREQVLKVETERQKYEESLLEKHRSEDQMIAQKRFQQQLDIENHRIDLQYNVTELHREEDRMVEQRHLEQQLGIAMEQMRQQALFEQNKLEMLTAEQRLTEKHRAEDIDRQHIDKLSDFMQEIIFINPPLEKEILELKVHTLIQRFDPYYKSLLIKFLYKHKLLNAGDRNHEALELQEANLNGLDLNGVGGQLGHVANLVNYSQISLPMTHLVNASFQQTMLDKANFTWCNLTSASFRSSTGYGVTFYRAILSLADFRDAQMYRSNFSYTRIRSAFFIGAQISESQMDHSELLLSKFQNVIATRTNFSLSELSSADFSYAHLVAAEFVHVLARSTNFYSARATTAKFSGSDCSNASFASADLKGASFRGAFATGSNFENANVQDVDFTGAFLAGAKITEAQLTTALSIAHAVLPDGSIGKNKNLLTNGNMQCSATSSVIDSWNYTGNFFIKMEHNSTDCAFQAKQINATITQTINVNRFQQMVSHGDSRIYLEMQVIPSQKAKTPNSGAYINIRFIDADENQIGLEQSLLSQTSFRPPYTHVASIPCPSDAAKLQITIVFHEAETTVDNVYVTIE